MRLRQPGTAALDYLRVDRFLGDMVSARALATAIELGVIDSLARGEGLDGVAAVPGGLALLLDLLASNGVAAAGTLTPDFRVVWERYRELLEMKLAFADAVACDWHRDFTRLLVDPGAFFRTSRIYDLFRYDLALDESPEALARARTWMRITTALTRHEAGVLLDSYDVSAHRRALDVGGNSGELMLNLCRANPALEALVMDLPAVCAVGREHARAEPRVGFVPGDARADALPADRDLITFKSMLHDWPEREARDFLARAAGALVPGGTLLVFERGPFVPGPRPPPYALIPSLLFVHCYRPAAWYTDELERLGLVDVEAIELPLDMPYHLVTGRRAR